ncbi:hypothetical protein LCGC14_1601960 [marine sediment metagenome]|uniref:Uncharacterized protein n=1 Tax=marine sediment metagenome TaxID=412755 RepID=A0A0F9IXF8_9ZZZZ
MFNKNEIPSTNVLVRVVLYFAVVVALGMSFSFTFELLNTAFEVGVLGTLLNVCAVLLFVRYVAAKHFTN